MKNMLSIRIRDAFGLLSDIYNLRTSHGKGRLISLGSGLVAAIYNVFITGIFYTGFLSMYGISIAGVGIITFIPMIASCFSAFSPMILAKFKRRKGILLASKIFFYAMYIIATTLMPQFILDPDQRLIAFIVILFIAYSVYALFSAGFTPWFYNFYPQDNQRRTRYILLNQVFSSIMSSAILLLSGLLTDAVAGSAFQDQLILGFRYFAFVLVIVDVVMQAGAKEYPYEESEGINLGKVFTLPFKYKKFILCMALMFAWNYVANLNNGLWSFHLLNHMNFSYTLMNSMSVAYTVILVIFSPLWQRMLKRYSWIKTFGIALLIWVPTEIFFFLMSPETAWMYVPLCLWQNFLSVGVNLAYANVLYMNLPEDNSTSHICFYSVGCNLFAFLGLMTGTAVSSNDIAIPMLGMLVYPVQFTTLMRAVILFIMGWICTKKWRIFTRDVDIAEIEEQERLRAIDHDVRRRAKKGLFKRPK